MEGLVPLTRMALGSMARGRVAEIDCLLAPESAPDEIRLSTTDPASSLGRHRVGTTASSSNQNQSLLAPMSSMNKTHLTMTLSAESRPAAQYRVWTLICQ